MDSMLLLCVQCDEEFEFTANEQVKYLNLGFDEPRRCPQCRKHKARVEEMSGRNKGRKRRYPYRERPGGDFDHQSL